MKHQGDRAGITIILKFIKPADQIIHDLLSLLQLRFFFAFTKSHLVIQIVVQISCQTNKWF